MIIKGGADMEDGKNTKTPISTDISQNLKTVKERFGVPGNFDFIMREFEVTFDKRTFQGFLVFYDGLVNKTFINRDIMRGLIQKNGPMPEGESLNNIFYKKLITLAPLSMKTTFEEIAEDVTFGHCLIFIDGCDCCFSADVKGWGSRGVNQPIREASLSGPQEAFNEVIMNNLALIRKILKDPNLIAENIKVGTKSNTPCAMLYIKGITNKDLVSQVRYRLSNIDTDYIFSSSDIEMLLETKTFYPITHTLKTERPDRAASMLAEGKVVIIVQGSPFVLVLPTTAADLIEASEDNYVRVPEANFMRLIRLAGIGLSLLLPGLFVAIMLFHHEILPTDLLLAIEASREVVPFPLVIELVLMELAFELIKEASIRIPSPVGSTLGIIGGLILGQAAVEANIVSPISIIIVSVAGLGAYANPSVALSRSVSLMKFIFIIFGSLAGLLGIVCASFITLAFLSCSSTYGVPFLSPITPKDGDGSIDALLVKPIWKKETRPRNLKTQNPIKQPHISRKWME